jgi:hypothetical protein
VGSTKKKPKVKYIDIWTIKYNIYIKKNTQIYTHCLLIFITVNSVGTECNVRWRSRNWDFTVAGWDIFRSSKNDHNGAAVDHWQDERERLPKNVYHPRVVVSFFKPVAGRKSRPPFFGNESSQWSCQIVPVLQAMSFCHRHSAHFKEVWPCETNKTTKNSLVSEVWSKEHPHWGWATTHQIGSAWDQTYTTLTAWLKPAGARRHTTLGGGLVDFHLATGGGSPENFMAMMILTLSTDYLKGQSTGNGKERGASCKKT